ncbi:DUF3097 domain-containing protein [Kineococcus gynurae]|uniref:DUF3097 domain-containing protein n=1 Tax=Kineococcus gynurae TaxID=452979 RepID=A0ABV5LQ50_9ACTN
MSPTPFEDRYGRDVLASDPHARHTAARPRHRDQTAERGLLVQDVETGWVGRVSRVEKSGGSHVVALTDERGRSRSFPLGPGFWVEGEPVRLVAPRAAAPQAPTRTASGSVAVAGIGARTARASRILVEGRHDAELVEKVWGEDLRIEGVVVEMLDGVDDLDAAIRALDPRPGRRIGVLVDHLVPGSKEWRIVAAVQRNPHVLVVGHPFVDVWQAVRPQRLGWQRWPTVPRGQSWKHGILAELGWPHAEQADVAQGWKRILATVRSYADLEPQLLGRVEELVDFVTGDASDG